MNLTPTCLLAPVRKFLLLCWLSLGLAAIAVGQDVDDGIHVHGSGEVLVEPDMARFTLQVTRQGRDAAALKDEMDRVTADVLKLTDSLGVDRKDVTAAMVQIQPNRVYENGTQSIDGVIASRSISIVLRRLDSITRLMNGALALGINDIGNVELDTSKRDEVELQAIDRAVENARELAEHLAGKFGVRLRGVRRVIMMGPVAMRAQPMRMELAADSSESFNAGQIIVRQDIQAVFAIGGE